MQGFIHPSFFFGPDESFELVDACNCSLEYAAVATKDICAPNSHSCITRTPAPSEHGCIFENPDFKDEHGVPFKGREFIHLKCFANATVCLTEQLEYGTRIEHTIALKPFKPKQVKPKKANAKKRAAAPDSISSSDEDFELPQAKRSAQPKQFVFKYTNVDANGRFTFSSDIIVQ